MMIKPWHLIPGKWAHLIAPIFLPLLASLSKNTKAEWKSFSWKNLNFRNPLGLAGGVDKTGTQLLAWQKLGAGFVEIGTITPLPQGPNPGKIIDRSLQQKALWNKMGFPNQGADVAAEKLKKIKPQLKIPLFINIGKNRQTSNAEAIQDYLLCFQKLQDFADAFVVNISSPNTKGLRDLQSQEWLESLLRQLQSINSRKIPLLVKLSPDLTTEALTELIRTAQYQEGLISGFILTNTTLSRTENSPFPPEGGVSGAPLKELSEAALKTTVALLGPKSPNRPLIISVGGILSPADIAHRFELGADLVQCYSALVIQGPNFFLKAAEAQWQ